MIVDYLPKLKDNTAHLFSVLKTGKRKLSVKGELLNPDTMYQIQSMFARLMKADEMMNELKNGQEPQVDAEPKEKLGTG